MQAAVHPCHLKFIFKIRYCAQTTQNYARILRSHIIHQQTRKTFHPYIGKVSENFTRHDHTLIQGKQSGAATFCHGHYDFAEQPGSTANYIFMPARDWIKSTRINNFNHTVNVFSRLNN